MTREQDLLVARLHEALVDEIRSRRPGDIGAPFTVAEIYQELVPYRTHRDAIGAAMNGDYEHALLRLLAGEGGYLVLDSEPARRRLEDELASPNPNTGVFREFAALDVRLNPIYVPARIFTAEATASDINAVMRSAPAASLLDLAIDMDGASAARSTRPSPAPETPRTAAEAPMTKPVPPFQPAAESPTPRAPAPPPAPSAAMVPESGPPDAEPQASSSTRASSAGRRSESAGGPTTCLWCRADLPQRESLRYCPFCGTDVKLVPCQSCGEELEPEWRFCISCGTEVATDD